MDPIMQAAFEKYRNEMEGATYEDVEFKEDNNPDLPLYLEYEEDEVEKQGYIKLKETLLTLFEGKKIVVTTLFGDFKLPACDVTSDNPYAGNDSIHVPLKRVDNQWYQSTLSYNPKALSKIQLV